MDSVERSEEVRGEESAILQVLSHRFTFRRREKLKVPRFCLA